MDEGGRSRASVSSAASARPVPSRAMARADENALRTSDAELLARINRAHTERQAMAALSRGEKPGQVTQSDSSAWAFRPCPEYEVLAPLPLVPTRVRPDQPQCA